jgi:predicted acylesterase/phospholipase RssA
MQIPGVDMVRPYDGGPCSIRDLQTYFPDRRPAPPARTFEFAIATVGGVSTGAYIAGVLDFLIEALDEFSRAQSENPQSTPTHKVRLANLAGASAGGTTAALAATCLLKDAPHVYDDAKWRALVQAGLRDGDQQAELSPLYRSWVVESQATRLLAPPAAETELALLAPAPAEIGDIVLKMLETRPDRRWPCWAPEPLDLRVLVGNLRGVPYTLTFDNETDPRAGERLTMHRDNVAFAVSREVVEGAPDTYSLTSASFNEGVAWALFRTAAVASSAIPGVFAPVAVEPVDVAVYQWRDCFFDTCLKAPILDQPFWETTPQPYAFTATDGGLFDNEPFDVAHRTLSGVEARNRRDGALADRAVIQVAAVVNDQAGDPQDPILQAAPPTTPLGRFLKSAVSIVYAPIEQSRWDAYDLALVKSENVFSRFMIAPRRTSPNPAHPDRPMGPSRSLMGLPLNLFLGFAAEAYRRHDFLLGRRNAQKFLADSFMLPAGNPIINTADAWEATDLRRVQDPVTGTWTVFYPIIPLRGAVHQAFEEPLPRWDWQALTDEQMGQIVRLFGGRAGGAWAKIRASLFNPAPGASIWRRLLDAVGKLSLRLAWRLWLRKALADAFAGALHNAKAQLDPSRY